MASNLNFVKFQRGTQAQYDNLKRANRLENDALYFIYDSTAPQNGGLLYMGDILIGGTGSAVGASALNDLTDVDLSGVTLLDGMILQYNTTSQAWEPVSTADFFPSVSAGAKTGTQTDANVLAQVDPTPMEGDIVFVDNVPYIYNGNSWQLLIGQSLEDRVSVLETAIADLPTDTEVDSKIATAISNANHLSYQVVGTLPQIANAQDNVVYLVGDGTKQGDDKYEEWMLVNNGFEKVGSFAPDLSGYVTSSSFQTTVGNLETSITNLQSNLNNYLLVSTYNSEVGSLASLRTKTGDNTDTIVSAIERVYDSIVWNDIPSVT